MEIEYKLGDKVECGDYYEDIMGGKYMTFYSITFTYLGENGNIQERRFVMPKPED